MQRIIVSDIFGRTSALDTLASGISGAVEIVDPYHAKEMAFNDEQEAYLYFTSAIGIDAYANQLADIIQSFDGPISLIGFSVGASIIWKLSADKILSHVSHAILFYGSQIRHYTDISPRFPTHLILPETEDHFSLSELINKLKYKNNITVDHTDFLHGFMNPHSPNYHAAAYLKYQEYLLDNTY